MIKKAVNEVKKSGSIRQPRSDRDDKSSNSKKSKAGDKTSMKNRKKDSLKAQQRYLPLSGNFKKTPPLKELKGQDLERGVRDKLTNCCVVLLFTDSRNVDTREIKQKTLVEIMDYINSLHSSLPEFLYGEVAHMFGCNIFRTLAPYQQVISVGIEDEEDYQLLDTWPHLQFVYEIQLKLLEHPDFDPKKAKRHIDMVFVKFLLDLFDSPDPRERDYLKTILHRIYGKMINLRSFIRKQINNIFYTFVYETDRHNGVAELLEILGSIINGFQVPIKDEHKIFLKHVLLPLHKPRCLNLYHPQLAYCITEFIKKDITLVNCIVVKGLIRFWPKMHSIKELMFLNELEECLELCDREQFKVIMQPFFRQLGRCVTSPNFQVCERALYLWTNADIVDLMTPNIKQILPLIFPSLYTSKQHWNKAIHSMVFNSLKVMMDMDQVAFDDYTNRFKEERHKDKELMKKNMEQWNRISNKAKTNPLHRNFSESISLSSLSIMDNKDTDKSMKTFGSEIQKHTTADMLVQKVNMSKAQAVVAKPQDLKAANKDNYSFKN